MSSAQSTGYLAVPSTSEGHPVLVLHAWWGLNDTIRNVCQRLADAGFTAYAPDLYRGSVTDQVDEAERLATALQSETERAEADLADAVTFLKERAGSDYTGIAVVGFSLGAFYALDLSVRAPEAIRAVVIFYGTGPTDFSGSQAEYLGHFAETDDFEPQSNVAQLEDALKQAGRPVTFYHYPGTGHWFCEPDRLEVYNPQSAELAWERTIAFLRRSSST